ncbi:MAG: GAF domain-containing protein, partial [Anaerolineae bacterium]|nr:GAF domain-containing protein [Anaerolineae bacterium]
ALVAPVAFRGQVIGALGVHDEDGGRQWTEQEVALVQAVVDRMGQAAENLRLLDDAQRREARERLTRQVADEIRSALTVDDAVQRTVKQLGDLLGAEMVARIGTEQQLLSVPPKEGDGYDR